MVPGQYAIDNNQTIEEIEEQLELVCDAIPSVGPTQSVFDCDKLDGLPDITFDFSDAEFTLSPDQYILRVSTVLFCPLVPNLRQRRSSLRLIIARRGTAAVLHTHWIPPCAGFGRCLACTPLCASDLSKCTVYQ